VLEVDSRTYTAQMQADMRSGRAGLDAEGLRHHLFWLSRDFN